MMFNIFLLVVGLFFLFLMVKSFLKDKLKDNFCVICLSISLTWIYLLVTYYLGYFDNVLIISLFMGSSILGIYYILDSKSKREFKVFRLPLILTLFYLGYILIVQNYELKVIELILALWLIFGLFFVYRNNPKTKNFVDKIIECCRKW